MPSDNEKGIEFPKNGNKSAEGKHKKQKKSIGWIIGVVVLILISVTFILPTTVFSGSSSIEFGRYNGEKIELEYGNYFYNQVATLSSQYPMNAMNSLQIYMQAYYSTVFEMALRQMAEQAGIRTTDSTVNDAIIQSGYFNNEDGVFDSEVYRNASQMEKSAVRAQVEELLPSQMVLADITSVRTSDAESDFVAALNGNTRTFQYITVGPETYPDTDAWAYAEANPAPFQAMDLSVITVATEDSANELLASIQNGEATFEDTALASSTDSYKDASGEMGSVMYMTLEDQLIDATNAATVYGAAVGDILGPFQTVSGYSLYRVNSAAASADLENEENLNAVKEYIAENDSETMSAYLQAKADEVYAVAVESWDDATAISGVSVTDVAAAAPNPASSSLINGLAFADPDRLLSGAVAGNEAFESEIFNAELDSVIAPRLSGDEYIIVRPLAADSSSELSSSYMTSLYPTIFVPSLSQMDLQSSVLSSDGFEDNFFEVYLSRISG